MRVVGGSVTDRKTMPFSAANASSSSDTFRRVKRLYATVCTQNARKNSMANPMAMKKA